MPKCNYCWDNPKGVYTGSGAWGGEWVKCPHCSDAKGRAKPTPRVEARLLAKARGFDGDDTNTINERLNNGND